MSFKPVGGEEVVWNAEPEQVEAEKWAHGGIPACWPWFGVNGKVDIHGTAWRSEFKVVSRTEKNGRDELVLALDEPNARLEYTVSLGDALKLEMKTLNKSTRPLEFSAGFHPYFLVRERDNVSVRGLEGCKYIYAVDMSEHVQEGDLKMNTDADHVYTLKEELKHEFAILDPGLKRALAMVSTGNECAVVWNPGPETKLADFEDGDWRKFICVEPVTIWPKALETIKPGEKHELVVAIQSSAEEAEQN
jgi:glucose-6-phosphate 1-epimerase